MTSPEQLSTPEQIPGYTDGTPTAESSPVTLAELEGSQSMGSLRRASGLEHLRRANTS